MDWVSCKCDDRYAHHGYAGRLSVPAPAMSPVVESHAHRSGTAEACRRHHSTLSTTPGPSTISPPLHSTPGRPTDGIHPRRPLPTQTGRRRARPPRCHFPPPSSHAFFSSAGDARTQWEGQPVPVGIEPPPPTNQWPPDPSISCLYLGSLLLFPRAPPSHREGLWPIRDIRSQRGSDPLRPDPPQAAPPPPPPPGPSSRSSNPRPRTTPRAGAQPLVGMHARRGHPPPQPALSRAPARRICPPLQLCISRFKAWWNRKGGEEGGGKG